MTRGQWTLIGLLVVQAMLIAVLRHPEAKGSDEPRNLVPAFETSSVTKIEVGTKPEELLVLERNGSDWAITTAGGYPADPSKVDELLEKIATAQVRAPVVASDKYHESLEVTEEKAQARIRLYRADSGEPFADLILGKSTGGGAHVRLAGREEVYDVRDLAPWSLRADTATWMQRKLVDIPETSVQRVAVRNEHGAFELERRDGDWFVVAPEESKGRTCTKEQVEPIIRAVASLSAAGPGGRLDPETQGLGDGATTVTLTHDEGSTTVRIGATVPENASQIWVTRDGFGFAAAQWESALASVKNARLEELLP